jgi:hypothetical protein
MTIDVSALSTTHTAFNVTLSLTPGLPVDEELTASVMDGLTEAYLHGLQDYLKVLGLGTGVRVTMQRMDYASND